MAGGSPVPQPGSFDQRVVFIVACSPALGCDWGSGPGSGLLRAGGLEVGSAVGGGQRHAAAVALPAAAFVSL